MDCHTLLPRKFIGILIGLVIAGTGAFAGSVAQAGELQVNMDEAHLIRMDQPIAEIIVGNPSIADVTVQSSKLLIVTGKGYGVTNLIILDDQGREVFNKKISVHVDASRLVTLRKGSERISLHCTPECQTPLVLGDTAGHAKDVLEGMTAKMSAAEAAVKGTSASGSQ